MQINTYRLRRGWGGALVTLLVILGACAPQQDIFTPPTPTEGIPPTTEPLVVASPEPAPTEAPNIMTLTVWLPDRIVPQDDENLNALINAQVSTFSESVENVQIDIRRKRAQDVGGIMSTLRTASSVAPGALPDVTLIRREDLLVAVQNGLIQPLEGMVNSAVIADLYPSALQLGQINNELYGLAYLLEAQIVVYQQTDEDTMAAGWSFEDMQESGRSFIFAASRSTGVSEVFLLQYLAAGGTFTPDARDGSPLNREALLSVLTFYETLLANGQVDPRVLDYANSSEYQSFLLDGIRNAGVTNTSTFWQLRTENSTLHAGSIPTPNGNPTTVLNGWVWVVVTSNTERQRAALNFINWMMGTERQIEYAQALRVLPSRQSSFRALDIDSISAGVLDQVLNNAIVPFSEATPTQLARQMQIALVEVLRGEKSAEAATNDLLAEISG